MHVAQDLAFGHEGAVLMAISQAADGFDGSMSDAQILALLDGIQAQVDLLTSEYVMKILAGAVVAQARVAVVAGAVRNDEALQDLFCALWMATKHRAPLAYSEQTDAGVAAH